VINEGARPKSLDVHENVGLFAPTRDCIYTLVRRSAQRDALTSARHRTFIIPRLFGSMAAERHLPHVADKTAIVAVKRSA
jgi:hypothetical protein